MYSDYIVYVDESGDHSLTSIDPQFPVFVLSFVVVEKEHYSAVVAPAVRRLKFEHFGHDMVVLHEADIRGKYGPFARLGKAERHLLLDQLSRVIADADITLFGVAIRKEQHLLRYHSPAHPYHLALQFGLERIQRFLQTRGQASGITHVIAEARGRREDAELQAAFDDICSRPEYQTAHLPFRLEIAHKRVNSEGLQLADLTARPMGLQVIRPDQSNRAWDVLETKLHRNSTGEINGYGFKVFP